MELPTPAPNYGHIVEFSFFSLSLALSLSLSLSNVCMGKMRDAYTVLMGKPEGKRPLARPARRWDYNIEVYLKNISWEGVD